MVSVIGQNASLVSVTILHYNRGLFSSIAGVQRLGAKSVKRPNVLAVNCCTLGEGCCQTLPIWVKEKTSRGEVHQEINQ